jgi:hypothetical protein
MGLAIGADGTEPHPSAPHSVTPGHRTALRPSGPQSLDGWGWHGVARSHPGGEVGFPARPRRRGTAPRTTRITWGHRRRCGGTCAPGMRSTARRGGRVERCAAEEQGHDVVRGEPPRRMRLSAPSRADPAMPGDPTLRWPASRAVAKRRSDVSAGTRCDGSGRRTCEPATARSARTPTSVYNRERWMHRLRAGRGPGPAAQAPDRPML